MFSLNSIDLNSADLKSTLLDILQKTEKFSDPMLESKFNLYVPTPVSIYFHSSPAKTRAILGGNRSSKTYSMIIDYACSFLGRTPKSLEGLVPKHRLNRGWRVRLNMCDYPNSFVKVIWPYIQKLIPSSEISDVIKDQGRIKAITNRYGGFIEFMVYESDVRKFQGSSRHACGYDEEPPECIRDENMARLIDTDGEEVFAATPLESTSTLLYNELYEKAGRIVEKVGDKISDRTNPEGNPDIHVFFLNIFDNHAISKDAALRLLSNYPEEERAARERGQFLFRAGLVYPEFSDSVHLIEPFNDWWKSDDYTLYAAIDPHPRVPHAVLFMVVRRDGWRAIVDELFIKCQTARQLVDAIYTKAMGKPFATILIDPLAFTPDPSTGSCFAFDLVEAGLYPVPVAASKDKSRGIILTRQTLAVDPETGRPGLYVTKNCTRFRKEISKYSWDEWRRGTGETKELKQKPIDKDDHMMECLYRLILLNPYWSPLPDEEELSYQRRPRRLGGYA